MLKAVKVAAAPPQGDGGDTAVPSLRKFQSKLYFPALGGITLNVSDAYPVGNGGTAPGGGLPAESAGL